MSKMIKTPPIREGTALPCNTMQDNGTRQSVTTVVAIFSLLTCAAVVFCVDVVDWLQSPFRQIPYILWEFVTKLCLVAVCFILAFRARRNPSVLAVAFGIVLCWFIRLWGTLYFSFLLNVEFAHNLFYSQGSPLVEAIAEYITLLIVAPAVFRGSMDVPSFFLKVLRICLVVMIAGAALCLRVVYGVSYIQLAWCVPLLISVFVTFSVPRGKPLALAQLSSPQILEYRTPSKILDRPALPITLLVINALVVFWCFQDHALSPWTDTEDDIVYVLTIATLVLLAAGHLFRSRLSLGIALGFTLALALVYSSPLFLIYQNADKLLSWHHQLFHALVARKPELLNDFLSSGGPQHYASCSFVITAAIFARLYFKTSFRDFDRK